MLEAVEVLGLLEVLLPKVDAVLSAPSLVELVVVMVLEDFLGLLEVVLSSWWLLLVLEAVEVLELLEVLLPKVDAVLSVPLVVLVLQLMVGFLVAGMIVLLGTCPDRCILHMDNGRRRDFYYS